MSYVVTAPLVIAKDTSGRQHHLYNGAVLFDEVDPDQLEQLIESDMVKEFTAEAEDDGDQVDGPPAKSASKGDWEAYARSQGATDEDLDGKTKDELVSSYGS